MRRFVLPILLAGWALTGPASAVQTPAATHEASTGFESDIAAAKSAMMADPAAAMAHARQAVASAAANPDERERLLQLATARWLEGEALTRLNRPSEAAPIIAEALKTVEAAAPGTKLNGDLLMSRGSIAGIMGNVQAALSDFQHAHNIFQAVGAARSQAIALQNIGSIYNDAGDYERVLSYYEQSADVYGEDAALAIAAHNNRGNAFKELGRYIEAEAEFREALTLARQKDSPLLIARILTNIASTQYRSGALAQADATALEALELTKDGPAAGWAPFLWGVRAQVAMAEDRPGDAAKHIARTFDGLDLATTTMPFRDFHEAAHRIYKALGNPALALTHLEAFKRLDDEAKMLAASTNSALLAAQFDYANQKLSISNLKAGQLERDTALAASEANYRSTVLMGLIASTSVVAMLSLFGFFWIRRSRNATREANTRLNAANADLERAVRARTDFLAMTSHEIRTPLNGILGMTQVMLMRSDLARDVRDGVELVHGAGNTMRALVDDILDVAKMESGKLVLEARSFDVQAALGDVAALARAQGEAKGLTVTVDLARCPRMMTGDEQRLRQIAFNLMSNAVKFTAKGGVTLTAAAEDGRLKLSVADTGIGIPADHLRRVFESFHQVDATISRQYGGTGLGLAICDHLARAMGGAISVTSTPGVGSTFSVDLPCPAADEPAPAERAVLVADANLMRQSMVAARLRKAGHAVVTADSAAEAAAAWSGGPIIAALVAQDLYPAGTLDLPAAMRALRAAHPLARVVVLGEADRTAVLACGVDDMLPAHAPILDVNAALMPALPVPAATSVPVRTRDAA